MHCFNQYTTDYIVSKIFQVKFVRRKQSYVQTVFIWGDELLDETERMD